MSRAARSFLDVFDILADAVHFTPAQLDANAQAKNNLLNCANRAYTKGYNLRLWEDAWTGSTYTPTNRFIDFTNLQDSRRFEVWSADPRDPLNGAYEVRYSTTSSGILLMSEQATVFILSMPKAPKFSVTAWVTDTAYVVGDLRVSGRDVYECLIAHTSGTFATDLAAARWVRVPVLAVLEEFTLAYAEGTYDIGSGQPQTGAAKRSDALAALEDLARAEYVRLMNAAWKPQS
jgi:hypothetical protein